MFNANIELWVQLLAYISEQGSVFNIYSHFKRYIGAFNHCLNTFLSRQEYMKSLRRLTCLYNLFIEVFYDLFWFIILTKHYSVTFIYVFHMSNGVHMALSPFCIVFIILMTFPCVDRY